MKVVFDFGGVLFRWHPASFLARVWPHRIETPEQGAQVAAQFFQNYGGDWGLFDQGLIGADEVVHRISARTGWPLGDVAAVVRAVPDELMPVPGTVALIGELREAGHRLHFLSNMPEPFAEHLSRAYPLAEWFESGLFSGQVKHIKPGAEIFAMAEQRFEARPEELLFLDDHPANIDAARARGWQATLFTDAANARRDLVSRRLLSA
jgi:putative hydrolase of the HAD superfamily